MVCKEAGYDFIELNASDARSKRTLDEVVSELLSNKTLAGFTKSKYNFIKCVMNDYIILHVDLRFLP